MRRRQPAVADRKMDAKDIQTVYEIMKKYRTINPKEVTFLEEEMDIDAFFRQMQTEVTACAVTEEHGNGDCGGFFLLDDQKALDKGLKPITVHFLRGDAEIPSHYYYSESLGKGVHPLLLELKTDEHRQTPLFQKCLAVFDVQLPFEKAGELFSLSTGNRPSLFMSEKTTKETGQRMLALITDEAHRVLESEKNGTFQPQEKPERLYVQLDMTAYQEVDDWKMAKIGVIYSEKRTNHTCKERPWKNGWVRSDNTRYIGSVREGMEDFSLRFHAAALELGAGECEDIAVLGDGAPMNWNFADDLFPGKKQILDWGHAVEYLTRSGEAFYGVQTKRFYKYYTEMERHLWNGNVDGVIEKIQCRLRGFGARLSLERKEAIEKTIQYYTNNRSRMRYDEYRKRGYDIGSGSVESACRQVVGNRLKGCGMFWSKENAESVLTMRCELLSGNYHARWFGMVRKVA
jgi:hypothetical protein